MDKFEIHGGAPLEGEISVSGAKNSALPALAACLLTADPVTLDRIAPVRDIHTMEKLLEHAGARVTIDGERVTVEADAIQNAEAPYDLVKTMRASSLVLGPLVASCGRARFRAPRMRHRCPSHQSACGYLENWAPPFVRSMATLKPKRLTVRRRGVFDRITVTGTADLLMARARARRDCQVYNAARDLRC